MIDEEVLTALEQFKGLQGEQQRQFWDLIDQCAALETREKVEIDSNNPLTRMLIE